MITVTNIRAVRPENYDEVWAIVRSLKSKSTKLKQVSVLSPSTNLLHKYLQLKQQGQWNALAFQEIYVPQFLREMQSPAARAMLNELYKLDMAGKRIALVCFCTDESLCHRSIIAGLLQGVGCHVDGVSSDYSKYMNQYKQTK